MADKPRRTTLEEHGVFEPDDLKTPANGIANPLWVRARLAALEENLAKQIPAPPSAWRQVGAAILLVGSAVIACLLFIDNRVAAQTDAGTRVHEQRITTLEQGANSDRAQNNVRFSRIEEGQLRTDKKLDALLDRLHVDNPAPTPPKDGGP